MRIRVSFVLLPAIFTVALIGQNFTPQERKYWAFQTIASPRPPAVRNKIRVRNPIDAFVLAKLEAKGLTPSPSASKIALIRRLTFDLTGLPPTAKEVDDFVADASPTAYENLVDRLLASPQYGERWARHWLDLARYAESEGFKADETRPNAWRYRDYVIRAFNDDKPYDRFVREQIAGDELWPNDPDARVATGFNRHYPDESNARNLMQRRQEILNDVTDTVGSVFTGLTYGCARCHDHKFDPIRQADYYRLQAFFANMRADDEIVLAPDDAAKKHREQLRVWEDQTRDIRARMAAIEEPKRQEINLDFFEKYPPEIQAAILKPAAERTPFEWQMYYKAKPYLEADHDAVVRSLRGDAKKQWDALNTELQKYASLHPGVLPIGIGITDAGREAPATHLLSVGVYDAPKEEVPPGFLSLLAPGPAPVVPGVSSTGRRTALANWLADPENPLTSRVMVNRLWHYHFGQGIVGTPSDFGFMGERPSHPELLDWLAREFTSHGWSMKHIHRLIVTSNTYRQASNHRVKAAKADPKNLLLWHYPRQRLEGEEIRDAALAVAGLLNPKMGGPSVFPELPPGMESRGGWKVTADPAERNRRSVYIFVRRNTRYPMLEAFDMPDTHESCARRTVTTTAPQALALLNSKQVLDWAAAFADRVRQSAGDNGDVQVETAYRLAYARSPRAAERESARAFLERQKTIAGDPATALADFCHVLINSNEFVYVN